MKRIFSLTAVLFLFSACMNSTAQTAAKEWTKHDAKKWFDEKRMAGRVAITAT